MLTVEEATAAILESAHALEQEAVCLSEIAGRIAKTDIKAIITQPPFAASAMDGYAVRFEDAQQSTNLKIIGEAPAGAPFPGKVKEGEAVRIFTGGVVPDGANHVVIQEDVAREGDQITIQEVQQRPRHIRDAGIDFNKGDVLVRAGDPLHEIHGAILAAANISSVNVVRRPRVAIFSNGDELMEPGAELKPGEIINSNHYALSALVKSWGSETVYLGCAADNEAAIKNMFEKGRDADIVIPIGGASVGDYDYVKSAFRDVGGNTVFEKVAVRPGKPTWFGNYGDTRVIGLPGNPASAIVTAILFVQPLIRRLAGKDNNDLALFSAAKLRTPLKVNGARESYLRAATESGNGGALYVTPVANQDSSLLKPFASANALIRRKANAPAVAAGEIVEIRSIR